MLVVEQHVRLREEGDEAVANIQLDGRVPGVGGTASAPAVELRALAMEAADVFDGRRDRDALRSDRTHQRVVHVDVDHEILRSQRHEITMS